MIRDRGEVLKGEGGGGIDSREGNGGFGSSGGRRFDTRN